MRGNVDQLQVKPLPQDAESKLLSTDIVCPKCGGGIQRRNGTRKSQSGIFQRYICTNGHNFTDFDHPIANK